MREGSAFNGTAGHGERTREHSAGRDVQLLELGCSFETLRVNDPPARNRY